MNKLVFGIPSFKVGTELMQMGGTTIISFPVLTPYAGNI